MPSKGKGAVVVRPFDPRQYGEALWSTEIVLFQRPTAENALVGCD